MNAVGHLIANERKLGRRKPPRKITYVNAVKIKLMTAVKNIGKWNFLAAFGGADRYAIVGDQNIDLFGKIIGKKCRFGNAADVNARLGQPSERSHRRNFCIIAAVIDPDFGIGKAAIGSACRVRLDAIFYIGFDRVAKP